MSVQFAFGGEIEVKKQILKIFTHISSDQAKQMQDEIGSILYQFHIFTEQNGESIVYRSQDQMADFIKHYNKKAKDLKLTQKATHQNVRTPEFLHQLSSRKEFYSQSWVKEFFDTQSHVTGKRVSVNLKKQSGGRYSQYKCFCLNWKACKVFILNDGIVTYSESKNKIQQFLHFGKDFHWETSEKISDMKIFIHSYHRKLSLKASEEKEFFIFIYSLQKCLLLYKKYQMQYRFNSFSPIRESNQVQFYVDGAQYYEAVAHAIQHAVNQVFICGWWVSPEFHMIRPCVGTNLDYRLDKLLARTARRDVKVYIVVYFQSSFLTNDSAYTLQALQSLHSNIKVLRHPQIILPTYWSHHEKLVVIDQQQAFIGGLDLCYGRYDNQLHLINCSDTEMYPGIQYNNCRIADFVEVRNYKKQNVLRTQPRLPWHDVALWTKGETVKDLSRHFIQYWNYGSYQTHYADRYVLISTSNKTIAKKKGGLFESILGIATDLKTKIKNLDKRKDPVERQVNEVIIDQNIQTSESQTIPRNNSFGQAKKRFSIQGVFDKISPNKHQKTDGHFNYKNEQRQSPTNEVIYCTMREKDQEIDEDQIEIKFKDEDYSNEMQESYLQMRESKRIEKTQKQMQNTMNELAKIEQEINEEQKIQERVQDDYIQQMGKVQIEQHKRNSLQFLHKAKNSLVEKIFKRKPDYQKQTKKIGEIRDEPAAIDQSYKCQILRSASQWSIGCNSKNYEKSIYEAYIHLIENSEQFIYIQNQFFISATHKNGVVKNRIMEALCNRVIKAISRNQDFKIMIIMPLIPGFAGELDDPNASLPRVIMNWQYRTICKGEGSLFGRLKKHTKTPQKYVQVLGLRTHGIVSGQPVTQIIYLHSKLMIVDDKHLICGSANINDRSMQGNRDSQLCILVQGDPLKQVIMGHQSFKVVEKIHNLRIRLWEEHFGFSDFKVRNAACNKLWQEIIALTQVNCFKIQSNTQIYRQLFGCYPDEQIKNLSEIKPFKKLSVDRDQYDNASIKIQGHAVKFPLQFLINEKLTSFHPNAIST